VEALFSDDIFVEVMLFTLIFWGMYLKGEVSLDKEKRTENWMMQVRKVEKEFYDLPLLRLEFSMGIIKTMRKRKNQFDEMID
jgi:hypothetical protein